MRPRSIVRFEQLYIAKIILGVIGALWGLMAMRDQMPDVAAALSSGSMVGMLGFGLVFGLALQLVLLHFVARRASEIARWIVVVFFAIACFGLLFGIARGTLFALQSYPATLLNFALSAACIWFLFQPDSVRWFRGERLPTDPF
jgi:hypothetical protein